MVVTPVEVKGIKLLNVFLVLGQMGVILGSDWF